MEVFDRQMALRQANGDPELVRKRCAAFSESAEATLAALEKALEERDSASLARLARELESGSSQVGAEGMENVAFRLAEAATQADWKDATELLPKLYMELGWFQRVIDERACSGNL